MSMTPEERQEFEDLKDTVARIRSCEDTPFVEAIKRFGPSLNTTGKAGNSENVGVDASSSATYSVLGTPDGFAQDEDGRYYPYYA